MSDLQQAARLANELKERLRPFVGRPLDEVRPAILAEIKTFLDEKDRELGGRAAGLREVMTAVLKQFLKRPLTSSEERLLKG